MAGDGISDHASGIVFPVSCTVLLLFLHPQGGWEAQMISGAGPVSQAAEWILVKALDPWCWRTFICLEEWID